MGGILRSDWGMHGVAVGAGLFVSVTLVLNQGHFLFPIAHMFRQVFVFWQCLLIAQAFCDYQQEVEIIISLC